MRNFEWTHSVYSAYLWQVSRFNQYRLILTQYFSVGFAYLYLVIIPSEDRCLPGDTWTYLGKAGEWPT